MLNLFNTRFLRPGNQLGYQLVQGPKGFPMKVISNIHRYLAPAFVAGLLCFSSISASAAPLVTKHVPAKAEGVIHIDVERLQKSSLWKLIEKELPKEIKSKQKLSDKVVEAIKEIGDTGIEDLLGTLIRDVRGVTIWGVDEDEWALTIDLPVAASLVGALEAATDLKKNTKSGVSYYRLDDDAVISVYSGKLIVGSNVKSVVASARLLDGKGKSIVGRKLKGLTGSSAKGIVVVAGFGGKLMKAISKEAASKAMKADIRSMLFIAGEHNKSIYLQAEVTLDSAGTATKLVAVANGLKGLLAISNDDPEIKALMKGLSVSASGNTIKARVEVPVKTLIKIANER